MWLLIIKRITFYNYCLSNHLPSKSKSGSMNKAAAKLKIGLMWLEKACQLLKVATT
jgi:hypothetical protein